MKKISIFFLIMFISTLSVFAKNEGILNDMKMSSKPTLHLVDFKGNENLKMQATENQLQITSFIINKKASSLKLKTSSALFEICSMMSVGTTDDGYVYWLRTIVYDCQTGVRIGAYDWITMEYISYE